MDAVVLGAGVVGVATAYYLAQAGANVTVIDRQTGPALETSFANGGQISANHVTPWATPGTPLKALQWLGHTDAPLLLHPRFDWPLARWLVRFVRNCDRRRLRLNVERAMRLALYSRTQLRQLREATGLQYDHEECGILHIFRKQQDYDEALALVELMNTLGCRRDVIDPHHCIELEPALGPVGDQLKGGIFSPDDETGDAALFTRGLAGICSKLGATFLFNTTIKGLEYSGDRIQTVLTDTGSIKADVFVVACASYSPLLLRPLGLDLPIVPAKGYSVTLPLERSRAPVVSIIDDEFKMVYSRLGDHLRIAGTAEFAGYDASVTESRARFLLDKALELFPGCGDAGHAEFWAGLRPSTPDGVPVLGRTLYDNLFLNTGHGTLGWTMACGSGRVLADVVLGRTPEISLDGLQINRFH
ncbi:MAG: D-amino acid dehydrogenase [Hyphomicrobiales bacterium]|nr:D-amino acid dehydrogenase [Hyphomicrobiales bacterium]